MTTTGGLRPVSAGDDAEAIAALLAVAEQVDGLRPVSEQTELALRAGGVGALVLSGADGEVLGLVHLEAQAPGRAAVAELVVHPEARRQGHGATLATAMRQAAGPDGVQVWAHGDLPGARALARRLGAEPVRLLHRMRRSLAGAGGPALPDVPRLPEGVRLRPFRPGADEEAWLDVNRRAFAAHPEQGRWDRSDLAVRQAEQWFDPAGFLLAERESDGALLGFHWTKVQGGVGEVYVVGVDPAAQGLGLGRVLVLAGLDHLAAAGLAEAVLYVDDDNGPAMRLYRNLGFEVAVTDVLWQLPPAIG